MAKLKAASHKGQQLTATIVLLNGKAMHFEKTRLQNHVCDVVVSLISREASPARCSKHDDQLTWHRFVLVSQDFEVFS